MHWATISEGDEGETPIHPYAGLMDEEEEAEKGKDRVLVWKAPGGHGVELFEPFDFLGVVSEFLEALAAASSSRPLSL